MKFLSKIENDTFDIEKGHKHDGVDSPLIKSLDAPIYPLKWEDRSSFTSSDIKDVAFNGEFYLGVCTRGELVRSYDGVNWNLCVSVSSDININAVTYGNGKFVAVGTGGTIGTTTNGISLTIRTSGTTTDLNGVCYGNGVFIAVGKNWSDYHNHYLYSTDGTTWTNYTYSGAYGKSEDFRVRYLNGKFYATNGGAELRWSTDGKIWQGEIYGFYSAENLYDIAYGNGVLVAVGKYETDNTPIVLYSTGDINDMNMTILPENKLPKVTGIRGIIFSCGKFIAVCDGGKIIESTNGTDWYITKQLGTKNLYSITEGSNHFAIVGETGTIYSSEKGTITDKVNEIDMKTSKLEYDGPVEIWSGTASADDDITLSQSAYNFRFLIVRLGGGVTYIPCPVMKGISTAIRGTNSYNNGTYTELYSFRGTLSDGITMKVNSLLVQLIKTTGVTNSTAYTTVTKIYGMK